MDTRDVAKLLGNLFVVLAASCSGTAFESASEGVSSDGAADARTGGKGGGGSSTGGTSGTSGGSGGKGGSIGSGGSGGTGGKGGTGGISGSGGLGGSGGSGGLAGTGGVGGTLGAGGTGGVGATGGGSADGGCVVGTAGSGGSSTRCPQSGDHLQYVVDCGSTATIKNLTDGRTYSCTLYFDPTGGFDCTAATNVGVMATVYSLGGFSTGSCATGAVGNIGIAPTGYTGEECGYTCTVY